MADTVRGVFHEREHETPEAKGRWFQSLTPAERMEYLCMVTDLVLENNPRMAEYSERGTWNVDGGKTLGPRSTVHGPRSSLG